MKFLKDSDAGRFTSKLCSKASKKHQAYNGYKTTTKKSSPKSKAKELPMSDEEKHLREELGLCYRSLYKEGLYEGCDTHLSLALDD